MKHTTIGKHLLTILLSLVMACALCVPAMAEENGESAPQSDGAQLEALFKTAKPEAGTGNCLIELESGKTYDLKDYEWTPIYVEGYNGAGVVTVDGKGAVITNLKAPLFAGGFAGNSGIVIKNLTIKDSEMEYTSEKNYTACFHGDEGFGAFISRIDSMTVITLENCHLNNVRLVSTMGARVGGLIGWTSGYNNPNDGPVDTYVTIRDCSVTDCTITANGSVGAIIGHAGNNPATFHIIENCKVTNTKLNSTDGGDWRVGVVVGTANVGKVNISNITESGNTLTQSDKTMPDHSNLYGRLVPVNTGALVIDNKLVDGSKGVVATVVDQNNHSTMYGTLDNAVAAAHEGSTITIWKDLSKQLKLEEVRDITINGNGHTIDLTNDEVKNNGWINAIELVNCQNIQIENLNIKGAYALDENDKFATGVKHGINSYHSTITVNNVKVEGCGGYGLVCNGSTAVVDGMTTSGNGWGGLNADSGSDPVPTKLTVINATCEETNSVKVENKTETESGLVTVTINDGTFKNVSNLHKYTTLTLYGGKYASDVQTYCAQGLAGNVPVEGYYLVHKHDSNVESKAAVAPTCTEAGSTAEMSCSVCGTVRVSPVVVNATGHNLKQVDAKAVTCTEDGIVKHWHCDICGKNYEDEKAIKELTNVGISAPGHDLKQVDAKAATCTEDGVVKHWHCDICGKNYGDEEAIKELPDVGVPATGHNLKLVEAVAATTEKEGNQAYYVCQNDNSEWFWDAAGNNPIASQSAVVTAKLTSQTEELKSEVGKPEETFTVTAEGSATSVAVKIDTDKLMENTADTMATVDTSVELKAKAVEELAKQNVTATAEEVTLILTPAVEVENVKVDEDKATITMDISLVCKVEAKAGGTVVPVAKETVPNDQIKQDTVITMSVPASWNGKSIIVRHETKDRGVKFYSAVAANGVATFTVPAEDGFSPFTLYVDDGATVTVKLDSETKTYNRTDVVNETALPAASKYNYAFKGWKFEGVDGQYFNMTAELFEALLDKNAVVIGSSVFEGPMSEHPEIEEAKKNGTWGVDENKPAATAKPAAAAAVTPVRSSIPKTSDDSNLMLWVCLMGIAALGLGGAVYMKKRNHQ